MRRIVITFIALTLLCFTASADSSVTTPDGSKTYIPNYDAGMVSVIDTVTSTITKTITLAMDSQDDSDLHLGGLRVTPDGTKVYVLMFSQGSFGMQLIP